MDFHEENLLAGFMSQPKVPTFMGDASLHVTSIRSPRADGCLCGRAVVVCDFKGRVAPGCNSELAYTLAHDLKLLHSVLHGSRRDSCFCVPSVLGLSAPREESTSQIHEHYRMYRCGFPTSGDSSPAAGHGSGHFPGHTMLVPLCLASLGNEEN